MADTSEVGICIGCGRIHGRFDPTSISIGTFWAGRCGWCGEIKSITSPSDYGYPKLPEQPVKVDTLDD